MNRREIARARWAEEDPEFLALVQEEEERLESGRQVAEIRATAGLSRSQFAALLGVDVERVELLESGDLSDSKENTLNWIRESLGC